MFPSKANTACTSRARCPLFLAMFLEWWTGHKTKKTNPSSISFSPVACEQGWTKRGAFCYYVITTTDRMTKGRLEKIVRCRPALSQIRKRKLMWQPRWRKVENHGLEWKPLETMILNGSMEHWYQPHFLHELQENQTTLEWRIVPTCNNRYSHHPNEAWERITLFSRDYGETEFLF